MLKSRKAFLAGHMTTLTVPLWIYCLPLHLIDHTCKVVLKTCQVQCGSFSFVHFIASNVTPVSLGIVIPLLKLLYSVFGVRHVLLTKRVTTLTALPFGLTLNRAFHLPLESLSPST